MKKPEVNLQENEVIKNEITKNEIFDNNETTTSSENQIKNNDANKQAETDEGFNNSSKVLSNDLETLKNDAKPKVDETKLSFINEEEEENEEEEDDDENEDGSNKDEAMLKLLNENDLKAKSTQDLLLLYEEYVKTDYKPDNRASISAVKIFLNKRIKEDYDNELEKFVKEGGETYEFASPNSSDEEKFQGLAQLYKEKRKLYIENQEKQKRLNFENKLKMLEELKELIDSDKPLKTIYDEFNNIVTAWKAIGAVPRSEANTLWQNYHHYVEEFHKKVKINKDLRDLDLRKNLELKIELCEKTEALLIEKSIIKSFKLLQGYHDQWREIGPVPYDQSDEIWQRFKTATDKINERRREYYIKIDEQQNKNYKAKLAICEKTEELLSAELKTFEDYRKKDAEIQEMINLWRSIGQVPKKYNEEIWTRFKTLTSIFNENKKEFFDRLKEQQIENYNQKVQICVQAEALINNSDWKRSTKQIIALQEEWKKIGPVPRKQSDKLWKRFRGACDSFFENKAKYYANIEEVEKENLKLKQDLIKKVQEYEFGDDRNENLKVLKNFQREWINISHVPLKYKNKIQEAFRSAINTQLDKLKISSVEVITLEYKTRMEQIKNNPGSDRIFNKEKYYLQNQLSKFKNDINLWENNIGFLANSKNADLLKEEFLKKIEKAKQEAAILEAKIKFLEKTKK